MIVKNKKQKNFLLFKKKKPPPPPPPQLVIVVVLGVIGYGCQKFKKPSFNIHILSWSSKF
jgi:hypothetical protein